MHSSRSTWKLIQAKLDPQTIHNWSFTRPHTCHYKHRIISRSYLPTKVCQLFLPNSIAKPNTFERLFYENQLKSQKTFDNEDLRGVFVFYFSLCLWFKTLFKVLKWLSFIHWKQGMRCILCIHWRYAPEESQRLSKASKSVHWVNSTAQHN